MRNTDYKRRMVLQGKNPYQKGGRSMLDELLNFDADTIDVDKLVELSAFARGMVAEYERRNLEVPEKIDEQYKAVDRAIRSKTADIIQKRLKEARARLATLQTTEEKRAAARAEVERLEKMEKMGASA